MMTVADLIARLAQLPGDLPVLSCYDGYQGYWDYPEPRIRKMVQRGRDWDLPYMWKPDDAKAAVDVVEL